MTVGVETFVAICSVALFALNEIFRDVEHDDDYGARARKQPASLSGALKPRSHCRHSGTDLKLLGCVHTPLFLLSATTVNGV